MKRETPDNVDGRVAGDALDRLVDEAIGEVSAQSPRAAVKARVMAAWDERHQEKEADAAVAAPPAAGRWRPAPAFLRPLTALAGTLAIVAGVFLAWEHTQRQFDAADARRVAAGTSRSSGAASSARASTPAGTPTGSVPAVPALPEQRLAAGGGSGEPAAVSRRRPRYVTVEWKVEEVEPVADATPHLPGAPAGDLGDPIVAMAGPRPITIAPIEAAPPVSEFSRPVTEFPADTQPPGGGEGADTGKSGGPRR